MFLAFFVFVRLLFGVGRLGRLVIRGQRVLVSHTAPFEIPCVGHAVGAAPMSGLVCRAVSAPLVLLLCFVLPCQRMHM